MATKKLSKNILQMKFMQPQLEIERREILHDRASNSSDHWESQAQAEVITSLSVIPDDANVGSISKQKMTGRRSFGNFNPVVEVC